MGRRKNLSGLISVAGAGAGVAVNGVTNEGASSDNVIAYINISALVGSVTFEIVFSPDNGVNWFPALETIGDNGSIATTGLKRIGARAPIGIKVGLRHTVVTGPITYGFYLLFTKGGGVP